MQNTPDDIDLLLPYGEALRSFLEQPFISPADLKHTLRARGIFLNRVEKRDTIPILICCLLCPQEFDQLRECQSSREDNPKTMTRTLPWCSRKSLLETIPPDLKLCDAIAGDITNYKVIGSPMFVPVGNNPNNISCEFQIEREDYSKSWAAIKSMFKGKLRIERNAQGSAIKFFLTHTATETKDLNHKFVKQLTQHFKANGDVSPNAEIETILFSSFINESRIAFFQSLTRNIRLPGFEFVGMTDFGAGPDRSHELPPDVCWMEDKVEGMKLNGVALQDIFFLKDTKYHKFFLFYAIEARFKFDHVTAKGTCSIIFEFPDFMPKKDVGAEFEANISALSLDAGCSQLNKTVVKEDLLRRINEFKLLQFEKFKLRSAGQPSVQLETALEWDAS